MNKQTCFKYTKKEFAEAMLKFGQIRIGTLYEYRYYDDEEIKDVDEGTSYETTYINDLTIRNFEEFPENLRSAIKVRSDFFEKGSKLIIQRSWFRKNLTVPNSYIYCVSNSTSKKVMKHFGYDTCIMITDIQKFKVAIGFQLMLRGLLIGRNLENRNCIYVGRKIESKKNESELMDIFWLKDERFKHQQEHRLLFPTQMIDNTDYYNTKLQPLIMNVPDIRNLIKIHRF